MLVPTCVNWEVYPAGGSKDVPPGTIHFPIS
jgi:hypothetical protein